MACTLHSLKGSAMASGIMQLARVACPRFAALTQQAAAKSAFHSTAAAEQLVQQQIRPANDLYMNGMFLLQQPWKAVLVDAAGERG